jgi:hypothetical protein
MAPPVGFKQLMEKIEMVEDQCSDESDKAKRNKSKLQDKEKTSTDPFVQKKMAIQEKIAETKAVRLRPCEGVWPNHCARAADKNCPCAARGQERGAVELGGQGERGNSEGVGGHSEGPEGAGGPQGRADRDPPGGGEKSDEEGPIGAFRAPFLTPCAFLEWSHCCPPQKPGGEEVVKQNIAKRDEILQVIEENIADLRFQERSAGQGGAAAGGGAAGGRDRLMGQSSSQAKTRPKPPAQNLDEMDAGTEGLDQAFLQIKKNDQELDQELDLVHQGVKRLGVMAQVRALGGPSYQRHDGGSGRWLVCWVMQEMNTELKIQNAMINETKQKAEAVNEHLLQVNKKMKRALDESGGASKMCINIICLIILLSVVGYIYKLLN